ncbi:MAG: TetR/AcrR family transcriptional regulator [Flavitalea sp.]
MSIAERKHRDKENMRTLILDAARKIFLEKGYEQTSIRTIAEAIEYSPGTIYLYFKDKDMLFHELHEEGFARMFEKMQPLQHVSDPFERLKAIGRVYMEFAKDNRDLYDLMFIMPAPMKHEIKEEWPMGQITLNFLKSVIAECQAHGRFKGKDIEYLSFFIWSCVHGMCALFVRDRCKAFENIEPLDLLENGYNVFVSVLEKN